MSDKLIIMQRLTRLLEGVTDHTWTDIDGVEQTVTYDLVGKVYRGRRTLPAGDAAGCMSILEAPREAIGLPAGRDGQVRATEWRLLVQGWPVEDMMNPSDPAYIMAAAVEKRLARVYEVNGANESGDPGGPVYPDDYLLGRTITGITVSDSLVLPAQENLSAVAFFYIPVTLSLVKNAAR